jgi:hypothetical protein
MTTNNLFAAALIATAVLCSPVMASEHHPASRHPVRDSFAGSVVPDASIAQGRSCIPAPRVGAFGTEPWTNPPCEPSTGY